MGEQAHVVFLDEPWLIGKDDTSDAHISNLKIRPEVKETAFDCGRTFSLYACNVSLVLPEESVVSWERHETWCLSPFPELGF